MSNSPWSPTGYGKQLKLFAPRINQMLGHDVAMFAYFGLEGGVINWGNMPVYPRAYHPYGLDVAEAHCKHFNADFLITLTDSWVIDTQAIKGVKWTPWAPIDHQPIPIVIAQKFSEAYQVIVYSKSAVTECQNAGIDCLYVPHGIDTNECFPGDKRVAREKLGLPQDVFIAGIVAMNKGQPSRKALDEQFEAFSMLKKKHKDAKLMVQSGLALNGENQGINLHHLAEDCGLDIREDIIWCDQYLLNIGFAEEYMTTLYQALDVLLSVTKGEGFGVPILESQACGTPVIVGNWTAMPELCFGGWICTIATPMRTNIRSYQMIPNVFEIADKLELAYNAKDDPIIKEACITGAMQYDADYVTLNYWAPALDYLAMRLADEAIINLPEVVFSNEKS